MNVQLIFASLLAAIGTMSMVFAVIAERRMHQHRQPGVSYVAATLRADGGWRRSDLFTDEGLRHQARAARFGWTGAMFWVGAVLAWAALAPAGR
jgi:hypothetical protein